MNFRFNKSFIFGYILNYIRRIVLLPFESCF
nr:MAG TPA: hypothetical protein [Caudoviricetes sp.]